MAKKPDATKASENTTAAAPAAAPAPAPAPATVKKDYNLTLFKPAGDLAARLSKAKRLTLPRMVLPKDIPIFTPENQVVLIGTVVKAVNSPASTVKGKCLWLILESKDEVLMPVTGSIRQCLAPNIEADSKELVDHLNKLAGKTLCFKRLDNSLNKKYQKEQFIFDVFEL